MVMITIRSNCGDILTPLSTRFPGGLANHLKLVFRVIGNSSDNFRETMNSEPLNCKGTCVLEMAGGSDFCICAFAALQEQCSLLFVILSAAPDYFSSGRTLWRGA